MDRRRILPLVLGMVSLAGIAAAAEKTPLADAAESRNKALVRKLVDSGADVNAPQADGMTALHWAVYGDDVETAALLLRKGAKVTATNRFGVPPLSLAATNGNVELVKLLLEAGADANTSLSGGETVLMTAARVGSVDAVKALLAHGANPNARERMDQTALMWAAAEGHAGVVRALIDGKADVNVALKSGFTPFFFAVREGHIDTVKALLAAGVDVKQTFQRQDGAPVPFRGPVARGTSALTMAVQNGHFELAMALVDAGADPNDRRTGFTPLHMVTWVRKPDASDLGDPAPIGSGRLTSLEFVRALVAKGANVNARLEKGTPRPPSTQSRVGMEGSTPFLMAADRADILLMRLLLELGADPKLPNAEGSTPLMAAAGLGTTAPDEEAGGSEIEAMEAVQFLLGLGADVNTVDSNGDTPMHGAAFGNFPKIVKLLADRGAKPELWKERNAAGSTPLFIAEGYRPVRPIVSRPTIDAILALMKTANLSTEGERPAFRDIYEKAPEPTPKRP